MEQEEEDLFSESASPEIVRELMALHRGGASREEMRRAFYELEEMEKRELSACVSPEEREELIFVAEAMDREKSEASKKAYRATYSRIRDDVKLRQRLSRMDPSIADAWSEADSMEKAGMPPQDVAAELRSRIDPELLEIMDTAVSSFSPDQEKNKFPTTPPEHDKKKTTTARASKLQRGFLLDPSAKEKAALVEKARAFPKLVKRKLRMVSSDEECERTCAEAMVAFSKAAQDPTIDSMTNTFEAAADEVLGTKCADDDDRHLRSAFVDAVLRLCIAPRYDGPPLVSSVVDFMFDVYERRRLRSEDDAALKRDVLAHLQRHGPGFLNHMESAATLLDGLRGFYETEEAEDGDASKKCRRQLHAHFRCGN